MPTKTFLRLPAEKQARLLDAAWAEFTRVSYADTSINNIVKDAGISRGSFYQYFADKDDLFAYLLKDIIDQLTEAYHHLLDQVHGDPFQLQLVSYDQFVQKSGEKQPLMDRFIQVVRINPGLDMQKLAEVEPGCMVLDTLAEYLDISGFRQQDPVFVHHVFFLLVASLCSAIMDRLLRPVDHEAHRQALQYRLDIIQHGVMDLPAPVNS